MSSSLLSAIGFFLLFSSSSFAFDLADDQTLECTELNVSNGNPIERSLTLKYVKEEQLCSSCGVTKFYEITYVKGSIPFGTKNLVTSNYAYRDLDYLLEEKTTVIKDYFMQYCGAYTNLVYDFLFMKMSGDFGPGSCLSCVKQ